MILGFPGGSAVKDPPAMREPQETRVQSLCPNIPWRRKWQPTPIFLPGKSHGQRSLVGLWGRKESDMTENSTHTRNRLSFSWVCRVFLLLPQNNSHAKGKYFGMTNLTLLHRERAQSFHTLSVHVTLPKSPGIWVGVPFSRGSSQPRDWTQVSHISGRFFTSCAAREAL